MGIDAAVTSQQVLWLIGAALVLGSIAVLVFNPFRWALRVYRAMVLAGVCTGVGFAYLSTLVAP